MADIHFDVTRPVTPENPKLKPPDETAEVKSVEKGESVLAKARESFLPPPPPQPRIEDVLKSFGKGENISQLS